MPGFGQAWHGVVPGRVIIAGLYSEIGEYWAEDGTITFFNASPTDQNSYAFAPQGVSRLKLSSVGQPGVSRTDYFKTGTSVVNGAGEMRLDFSNGEYVLYRRADAYRLSPDIRFLVPVEHGFPSGYKQWFDYPDTGEYPGTMRDSFGRQAQLTWQVANLTGSQVLYKVISQIQLPDGTSLSYQYEKAPAKVASQTLYYVGNPQDRLVSATRKDAAGTTLWSHSYLYEDLRFPYALTGIVDQGGNRLSTYAYSNAGLAISTEKTGGFQKHTVDYLQDAAGQPLEHFVRTVTGPLGQVERYSFFRGQSAPSGMQLSLTQVDRLASTTVPAATQTYSYTNSAGYDLLVSGIQNPRGTSTTMAVDTVNRRPNAITEAAGTSAARTTTTTWHPQFDLPLHEERQGLSTDYTYTPAGQLLSRTETDTTTQTVPYATSGQTRTETYTWDANGRLLSVNGPLAADASGHDDTVTYTYDSNGNRLTMTDGLGHVTSYGGYDANGRPGTMTDMNGIVTAFTYDGLGHVKTITVKHPSDASLDAVTSLDYDSEGRVTGVTRPATETIFLDYNLAGLLTAVRTADGERTDYQYDAMGNVLTETVKRSDGTAARTVARTFDSLGRMLSETLGPGRTTRWTYDANGNATALVNPAGSPLTQAFDPLDRVVSVVAPDGGTTGLAYDQKDGLTQNTDPKAVVTQFVRNGFGEVIQESSPDRGTSVTWYDAAGNVTRTQDGRGQIVDYTRDVLGRVLLKVPQGHAGEAVSYSWDTGGLSGSYGIGRLGSMTDASGTTRFAYDHRGNLLVQEQSVGTSGGAQLTYAYDLGDRITQITYPSGRIVQYGRDAKGRVNLVQTKSAASVGSWTVLADSIAYEPFGSVKAMRLGNGLSAANDWGNDGRLAERRLYRTATGANLSWLTYGYDAKDNIISITDRIDDSRSAGYGYDVNDRLTWAVQTATGPSESGDPTTGSGTYAYAEGTNRLAAISGTGAAEGTSRTFSYDGRGNLAGESRPGAVSASTSYDGYGRLTGYARSDIAALAFAYNGRDDRVSMTSASLGTRFFVYGPDARVLGEYGQSAADVKAEFIWLAPEAANDNALGGDDGTGGYAPLALVTPDSSGAPVLSWVYGNHLGVPIVTTDASGNPATPPSDYLAPGFPGQSRVLADLYYNRYRDFDPTTGRYIQADPIGLNGGQNRFAYVDGNPVNRTDPLGLSPLQITPTIFICSIFPSLCILPLITPPPSGPQTCAVPHNPNAPLSLNNPDDPDEDCLQQWIEDTAWCDNNTKGRKNIGCHRRAEDNYTRCKKRQTRLSRLPEVY